MPIDVQFRDIDAFGHVNNATYFSFFEIARTRYWLELVRGRGAADVTFIVAHAECDFLRQVGLEPIEVLTRITELRNSSLDFIYEVRKSDGALAATGKTVVVFFDWETKSKRPITDEFRRRVEEFQKA